MKATLHQCAITPDGKKAKLEAVTRLDPHDGTVRLRGGNYVKTRDAVGWTVCAQRGVLWITQDWDSRDIVLNAGQSFVLDRMGTAVLWPLGEAEIRLARDLHPCASNGRASSPATEAVA